MPVVMGGLAAMGEQGGGMLSSRGPADMPLSCPVLGDCVLEVAASACKRLLTTCRCVEVGVAWDDCFVDCKIGSVPPVPGSVLLV